MRHKVPHSGMPVTARQSSGAPVNTTPQSTRATAGDKHMGIITSDNENNDLRDKDIKSEEYNLFFNAISEELCNNDTLKYIEISEELFNDVAVDNDADLDAILFYILNEEQCTDSTSCQHPNTGVDKTTPDQDKVKACKNKSNHDWDEPCPCKDEPIPYRDVRSPYRNESSFSRDKPASNRGKPNQHAHEPTSNGNNDSNHMNVIFKHETKVKKSELSTIASTSEGQSPSVLLTTHKSANEA